MKKYKLSSLFCETKKAVFSRGSRDVINKNYFPQCDNRQMIKRRISLHRMLYHSVKKELPEAFISGYRYSVPTVIEAQKNVQNNEVWWQLVPCSKISDVPFPHIMQTGGVRDKWVCSGSYKSALVCIQKNWCFLCCAYRFKLCASVCMCVLYDVLCVCVCVWLPSSGSV